MGQVTVTVNGRAYRMACRDGEENRVSELAAFVESHVKDIKGNAKLVQEERLFLMAALMLADQLLEAREELQRALRQLADLRLSSNEPLVPESPARSSKIARIS